MQAPKKKTSKSRRNMRRSHHALTPLWLNVCPNCGESVRSHSICTACGHYRGRQILTVQASDKK